MKVPSEQKVISGMHSCSKIFFSVLYSHTPSLNELSLRDCSEWESIAKPRPTMVKLSNTREVNVILSNRAQLSQRSNISVKPHLPTEKLVELLQLSTCRSLIGPGTDSRSIKLWKSCLFIGSSCVGTVRETCMKACKSK